MGIGGLTVSELNQNMTVDEFLRWQAYFQLEPSGGEVWLEKMIAQLCALTANVNRKKGKSPYKAKQFMLKRDGKASNRVSLEGVSSEQAKAFLYSQYLAMGGEPQKQ